MTTKGLAFKYVAGQLRGDRDGYTAPDRGRHGAIHVSHNGALARIHSAPPPPVEEYARWLEENTTDRRIGGRHAWATPEHLRRAVTLRRNGSSWQEIASATAGTAKSVRDWVLRLPEGLGA